MLKNCFNAVRAFQQTVFLSAPTFYTDDHEYVFEDGTSGITDFAQDMLGEIIHLEFLVDAGDDVDLGDVIGEIESVKSVSEIYSPVTGTVVEINEKLGDDDYVSILNEDAEGAGWIYKFADYEIDGLLNEAEYQKLCDDH